MFILGHIGISMGIVLLIVLYYYRNTEKGGKGESILGKIDFRIIAISAMIPDIIDKTMGMWILGEEVANGRLFTHSLITITIISIAVLNLSRIKFSRISIPMLYILPAFLHLALDGLWEEPGTLFWPLLGTGFPNIGVEFGDYFEILLSRPVAYIGEIIGLTIIIMIFIRFRLYLKDNLANFFKKGQLS